MGVSRNDYVIWGADVGYDNVDYDEFEDEIDGTPDARFQIIYDGMSGKYAMAGVVVARSDDYEGFDMTDISAQCRDLTKFYEVMNVIIEQFPHLKPSDFGLKVFSHFR